MTVPLELTEDILVAALKELAPERRQCVIEKATATEPHWGREMARKLREMPPLDPKILQEMREEVENRAEAWGE